MTKAEEFENRIIELLGGKEEMIFIPEPYQKPCFNWSKTELESIGYILMQMPCFMYLKASTGKFHRYYVIGVLNQENKLKLWCMDGDDYTKATFDKSRFSNVARYTLTLENIIKNFLEEDSDYSQYCKIKDEIEASKFEKTITNRFAESCIQKTFTQEEVSKVQNFITNSLIESYRNYIMDLVVNIDHSIRFHITTEDKISIRVTTYSNIMQIPYNKKRTLLKYLTDEGFNVQDSGYSIIATPQEDTQKKIEEMAVKEKENFNEKNCQKIWS